MALALLLLLWLITLATAYLFAQSWLPAAISSNAFHADRQLLYSLALLGIIFAVAQMLLGWMVWRHREGTNSSTPKVKVQGGSLLIEWASVAAAASLFLGINLLAAKDWADHSFVGGAGYGAVRVEVTGQQFRWYFRYPGEDGKFGAIRPELQDASVGNPLGIDPADKAGADDKVSAQLVLPATYKAEITLRSQDVIHSFFVPELRLKQDEVPGMETVIHFSPNRMGEFEVVCAELCGQGHHQMNAKLKVVTDAEYRRWVEGAAK